MKHEGKFVWRELMTTDVDAAMRYYGEVAGWKFNPVEMSPGFVYTLVMAGEREVGGMMKIPEGESFPAHWASMVVVADADAATERARSKGAKILAGPMTAEGIGRWSVVMDAQGAVFTLYCPATEGKDIPELSPGDFCWEHLATTDPESAKNFYTHVTGWSVGQRHGEDFFKVSGDSDHAHIASVAKAPENTTAQWLTFVFTDDLDAVNTRVKRYGGEVIVSRVEVPQSGFYSLTRDPQGAAVCFYETLKK